MLICADGQAEPMLLRWGCQAKRKKINNFGKKKEVETVMGSEGQCSGPGSSPSQNCTDNNKTSDYFPKQQWGKRKAACEMRHKGHP